MAAKGSNNSRCNAGLLGEKYLFTVIFEKWSCLYWWRSAQSYEQGQKRPFFRGQTSRNENVATVFDSKKSFVEQNMEVRREEKSVCRIIALATVQRIKRLDMCNLDGAGDRARHTLISARRKLSLPESRCED